MGRFLFFIFSCWGMPVLTWLRKSPPIGHGFQAGSPGIAVRQLAPRLSPASVPVPLQTVPSCEQVGGAGAPRRLLGEHLAGETRSRGRQRPPLPLHRRARGRGRDEGGARGGPFCCGARARGGRGGGCVDRTTTVLFAVLIPPVGSGGTEAGRVPGICLLPRSRRECQGHGEGRLGPARREGVPRMVGAGVTAERGGFCSNGPKWSPTFRGTCSAGKGL